MAEHHRAFRLGDARARENRTADTTWKNADLQARARPSQPRRDREQNRRWRYGSLSTMPALPPFGFRSRQPRSLQNLSIGNYLHFSAWPTFAKKCQQRVMTMQQRRGGNYPPQGGGE